MGMSREQAISYLRNSGFSEEQINEIVKALEPTTKNDLGVDMINQLITKTANTMNVSKAHVATAIDTLINTSQPYKPIQGLCKSAKKNDLGVDREDAVERLNALKQFIGYDEDSEIVKATQKSIDMAISALEHPERNVVAVVPCGDTISRQAVIDLMMQKWGENFSGDDAMQESIDAIRVLPSVTPQEPRKGRWEHGRELSRVFIGATLRGINYEDWHCSNCHCVVEQSIKPKWSYCPNCGCRMVEPQESEG